MTLEENDANVTNVTPYEDMAMTMTMMTSEPPRPTPEPNHLVEAGILIRRYGTPPIAAIGVVGNILTLIVMQKPGLKSSTSSIYFSSLAVVETLHLVNHLLTRWVPTTLGWDIFGYFDITCKLGDTLSLYSTNAAAWLVVALTVERFLVTTYPLHGKRFCTRRAAVIVSVAINVIFAALWLIIMFKSGATTGGCNRATHMKFLLKYGSILGISLYTIIPTPLLITLNAVLIRQVAKARRARNQLMTSDVKGDAALSRVTVMAVTVSMTYFLLTLPAPVLAYTDMKVNVPRMWFPLLRLSRDVAVLLRELNHGINFFLYLLVLPKVTSELAACFCRAKKAQDVSVETLGLAGFTNKGASVDF